MKYLYTFLGSVFLVLGIVGIVVPVLPTTPFLLLAAAMYVRGSARLYNWLMNQKLLGRYITQFRTHRAIPLRAKVYSLVAMWATMLFTVVFVISLWWVKILLLAVALAVTVHILSFKTLR